MFSLALSSLLSWLSLTHDVPRWSQHDVLFSVLTAKEHIDLYAAIKGVKLTRSEVSDMLAKVVILSLAEKARQ